MRSVSALTIGVAAVIALTGTSEGNFLQAGSAGGEQRASADEPRPPVVTVKRLARAASARDGKLACALVTRYGRSVLDASNLAGRKECIRSVNHADPEDVDVRLIKARSLRKSATKAMVAATMLEDDEEREWVISLLRQSPRGWLIDDAQPR